jgi:hypothetical protein
MRPYALKITNASSEVHSEAPFIPDSVTVKGEKLNKPPVAEAGSQSP